MYLIILLYLALGLIKVNNSIAGNKILKRTDYLLPANLQPSLYQIELEPNFETDAYVGSINITFSVKSPTYNVVLHKKKLEIDSSSISLLNEEGNIVNEVVGISYSNDDKYFYTITLKASLVEGAIYTLVISSFNNTLTGKRNGFYLAKYKDANGVERKLATTHMEPLGARIAFPCFDEPALKAEFEITVIRPAGYNSISNMPKISEVEISEGRFRDKFAKSVKMSTYLVAIVVSNFANISHLNHRVFGRPGSIANNGGDFVLVTGIKFLNAISEFLNVSYALPKIDQVAIPQGYYASAAMENWGLVTYQERQLIFRKGQKYPSKEKIALLMAHEITHQWLGNLVTPTWWSYIWLSEGFAKYLEYYFTSKVFGDDELLDVFVEDILHPALVQDSEFYVWSMNEEVGSPKDIYVKFKYSYFKPASVLRMIHHVLSTEVFRKGLNTYLNKMEFQAAEPEDLYSSWQQVLDKVHVNLLPVDKDVTSVMSSWDASAGYPLITVERNYSDGSVTISQRRFLKENSEYDNTIWYVPITYTTGRIMNFSATSPKFWLTTKSIKIRLENLHLNDWLIVNIQQTGYYRVSYDFKNWKRIIEYLLKGDFFKVHHLNRAQLLDDSFGLMIAGVLNSTIFSKLLEYIKRETDYIPLHSFTNCLKNLDVYISNIRSYDKFQSVILNLLDNAINAVGFEDNQNESDRIKSRRDMLVTLACEYGRQDCKKYGLAKVKELARDKIILSKLRTPLLCAGIRIAEQNDWDFAYQMYTIEKKTTVRRILLQALGCSGNETISYRFLDTIIRNGTDISAYERYTALMSMCRSAVYSRNYLFDYIKKKFNKISASLSMGYFKSVINCISSKLSTSRQYSDMEVLSKVSKTPTIFEEGLKTIRSNIDEADRVLPAFLSWLA